MLVAGDASLTPASLGAGLGRLPSDLRERGEMDAEIAAPGLRGGTVYTDDKAPVEWLVDASLVEVATEGGER